MAMLTHYCGGCHNDKLKTAGFTLTALDARNVGGNLDTWEKVLRRVSLGEMPPHGMRRPTDDERAGFTHWLEASLDGLAAQHPDPGRSVMRRLNRAEYANAVRDLLDLKFDLGAELPADASGYGFDNIADLLSVSPTLLDRYVAVAGKVSRMVTGTTSSSAGDTEYILPKDLNYQFIGIPAYNERASDELPLGSRGGAAFKYYVPHDGIYRIQVTLNPNTVLDNGMLPENTYETTVNLKSGTHFVGASFSRELTLDETPQKLISGLSIKPTMQLGVYWYSTPPKALKLHFNVDRAIVKTLDVPAFSTAHNYFQANFPRDILKIAIRGPLEVQDAGLPPSGRKIFICHPSSSLSEDACARLILAKLARQAYRRPVTKADLAPRMRVYARERGAGSGFETGIGTALQAILVSPHFLFVHEEAPQGPPGSIHPISDLELATRLSLFLWSSIPDDHLLDVAEKGRLHDPVVLDREIARMLADPKAQALADNFAGQWLYVRNLKEQHPDSLVFRNFDERLRKAMLDETNMFVMSVFRENRSVLTFLDADYTFVNERLSEHYGIPGVHGTTMRRVNLDPKLGRGGLLGEAGILTVTSYNNRTSVVKRGKWILENILAAPPPPPPPNVPDLQVVKSGRQLSSREAIEVHRANPVCASCHSKMDPLGLALENFDAVGTWRQTDAGQPVDASTALPDGTAFSGLGGLKTILLSRKDQFAEAFTERLMTYALGRGLVASDMPAVRSVRRAAQGDDYRARTIVRAIVQSVPFEMRRAPLKDTVHGERIAQK